MDHVAFQYENDFMFKWKWNNSMWLPLKTSEWVLGRTWLLWELSSDGKSCLVSWRALIAEHMYVGWIILAVGYQKEVLLLGRVNYQITFRGPLDLQLFDPHRVHRAMPVIFKLVVPKGHESGRGESLLDASSADKPANCIDCQSEEWKERSKRGNFVFNFFYLFHRKAHKVIHSPSIHS